MCRKSCITIRSFSFGFWSSTRILNLMEFWILLQHGLATEIFFTGYFLRTSLLHLLSLWSPEIPVRCTLAKNLTPQLIPWLYLNVCEVPTELLFSHLVVSDSATAWTAAHQASLSFTVSRSLLKLMSVELVMLSNHLILCHPLLLPSVFPSIKVFSNELALHIS